MVARLDKVLTEFDKADADSNGHIDQREWEKLELEDRRRRLDDENSKRDQQRKTERHSSRAFGPAEPSRAQAVWLSEAGHDWAK